VPTALDFLVEDVRLVAAAARAGALAVLRDLPALRDLDAELFEGLLAAVRAEDFEAEDRVEDFAAVDRAEDFEAEDRAAGFALLRAEVLRDALVREDAALRLAVLDGAFLAVVLREAALRVEDFAADLAGAFLAAEREVVAFAAVFLAPDLAALVLLALDLLAPVLDAALRLVVLDGAFLAAVLREAALRVEDFAADLVPVLEAVFVPLFAALLRDEVPADFAADLRAVFVPLLALDDPLFLLEELRRALLFFLVLVAPESPVNSIVSGFDFSSVGIAASFKGLRVQPSRFEGNVVIPSGFRLTESVESKTGTFSVDTFRLLLLSGLRSEGAMHPAILLFDVLCRVCRSLPCDMKMIVKRSFYQ